jgi:hypothetical protein
VPHKRHERLTPILLQRVPEQVRPGAKEVVVETPWSQGKGLGSRKFDDFDFKTGTGFEANTTPWSQMTQEQLSRKLDQLASDFALLRTNPDVNESCGSVRKNFQRLALVGN